MGGVEDLMFRYRTPAGTFVDALATYVSSPAADFNDNGTVGSADLGLWKEALGASYSADADQDGDSDGRDLLLWQQQLGSSGPSVLNVPEPDATPLLAGPIALATSVAARGLKLKRR
jgi:hypothetical protein